MNREIVEENNKIIKTLECRNKILGEQEQLLDNIIKNGQKTGEQIRGIVVDAEWTKSQVKKNIAINEIIATHSQNLPSELNIQLTPLLTQDEKFLSFLKELNTQVVDLNSNVSMVAASSNTMPITVTSSTSGTVYFSIPHLNDPVINKEMESVKVYIFENVSFIEKELINLLPNRSKHFESIIKDWYSAGDSDLKYKSILNLRSFIFDQLFEELCHESDYTKTIWFKSATNKRKRFCQAKFFVLGFEDENTLPLTQKNQIGQLATDTEQYFHDMSEQGKKGFLGMNLDVLFEQVISNFRILIQLRKTFHKKMI